MDINKTVAGNVKKIRELKGYTLDGAAALTGVSRSMLAQIEKGVVNPTITVLWKIANGYKVSFTSLVEENNEEAVVLRAEGGTSLSDDEGRYLNFPVFAFDEKKQFETYRIEIAPSGSLAAKPHPGGTEEYITVFAGVLQISIGGSTYLLETGDSIHFKADAEHTYKNPGTEKTLLSMLLYYEK